MDIPLLSSYTQSPTNKHADLMFTRSRAVLRETARKALRNCLIRLAIIVTMVAYFYKHQLQDLFYYGMLLAIPCFAICSYINYEIQQQTHDDMLAIRIAQQMGHAYTLEQGHYDQHGNPPIIYDINNPYRQYTHQEILTVERNLTISLVKYYGRATQWVGRAIPHVIILRGFLRYYFIFAILEGILTGDMPQGYSIVIFIQALIIVSLFIDNKCSLPH